MVPLQRLNAIVVFAVDPAAFTEIDRWLLMLDIPPDKGAGRQTFVYNVENAKAADLAAVLNELFGGGEGGQGGRGPAGTPGAAPGGVGLFGGAAGTGRGGRRRRGEASAASGARGVAVAAAEPGFAAAGSPAAVGGRRSAAPATRSDRRAAGGLRAGSGSQLGGGGGGRQRVRRWPGGGRTGQGSAEATPPVALPEALRASPEASPASRFRAGRRPPPGPAGTSQGPLPVFRQEVRIVADEVTNSLVVLATKRDYQLILDVVQKIDVVPRQVVLEVMIAEVDLNKDLQFGIAYAFQSGQLEGRGRHGPTRPPISSPTPGRRTSAGTFLNGLLETAARAPANGAFAVITRSEQLQHLPQRAATTSPG